MGNAISIAVICAGASIGACLRWAISQALNHFYPALPPGTLAANWLGAALMGCFLGAFSLFPCLNSCWRLFLTTGLLGSLTTFSTFSAEMSTLILQGRWFLCFGGILLHVAGSIILTLAAYGLVTWGGQKLIGV